MLILIKSKKSQIMPTISVIVTTYNRKKNLSQALNSILKQTFFNFEIVVIDNYSNYDIKSFIKEFDDDRIMVIQNNNKGNYVINRNLGIKKSRGEYITFCDDDDYWLPDKLTDQLELFSLAKKSEKVGLVYSKCHMLGAKGIYRVAPRMELYNGHVFHRMLFIPSVPILTAMVKREVFESIGYFNEDRAVLCQEDNEFWIRLSKYYSVKSSNTPTAVYREHEENLSNSNKITLKARLYLHKHMIDSKIISYYEWLLFALPGLFFAHYLRRLVSLFRKILGSFKKNITTLKN